MELLGADQMSRDFSRPVRDDFHDWRLSVEREWENRERLERIDDRYIREGTSDSVEPDEEDE